MNLIKGLTYNQLRDLLLGKKVHFVSDCEFFPNFNVYGKVISMSMNGTEVIFRFRTNTNRIIQIGSNMLNLRYELI